LTVLNDPDAAAAQQEYPVLTADFVVVEAAQMLAHIFDLEIKFVDCST